MCFLAGLKSLRVAGSASFFASQTSLGFKHKKDFLL